MVRLSKMTGMSMSREKLGRCEKSGMNKSAGLTEVAILMLTVVVAVAMMLVVSTCLDEVGEIACMLLAMSSIMFSPLLAKAIVMNPSEAGMYERRAFTAGAVGLVVYMIAGWLSGSLFAIDCKAHLSARAVADLRVGFGVRMIILLPLLETSAILLAASRARERAED